MLSPVDIIRSKRNGAQLTREEIQQFVTAVSNNNNNGGPKIHDAQIGAFLMAAFLKGFSLEETIQLTHSMTYSGFTFSWPDEWAGSIVDKHSTGGVGDKVSLVLAPALAACGMKVPMVSGRGLDFTGGTLDKLEAIPGFNTSLPADKVKEALEQVGCCIVGQTKELVPADRILYAIRDVTATVDNQDLIVASIISKKAAESLDALVLDVKVGAGAFMKDEKAAADLATKLVGIGRSFGMKVAAALTRMDDPIGYAIGNALEVYEAIITLRNEGPEDLLKLVTTLGGKLLQMTGRSNTLEEGEEKILATIKDKTALKKFHDMILFQGAIPDAANEICSGCPWKFLPKAPFKHLISSSSGGVVQKIDAMAIARACLKLGCGRTTPTDAVQQEPGVMLKKKPGDRVNVGDVIAEVHHNQINEEILEDVTAAVCLAFEISEESFSKLSLLIGMVE